MMTLGHNERPLIYFHPPQVPQSMSQPPDNTLEPLLKVSFPPSERLGRGKIELLEHIRETGSISAAGRRMDMSYRRAWLLVDAINAMFTEPAVASQRGGKQGGGAQLTPFGEALIKRFRRMEEAVRQTLQADLDWLESHRKPVTDPASADQAPPTL